MRRVYLFMLIWLCSACATSPDATASRVIEPVVETAVELTNETTAQLAPPPKPKPFDPLENVNLKAIDQTLVANEFNIQFVTQSSPNCNLIIKYPQVSGLADAVWQKELNGILKQEMMRKMRASKGMVPGNRCKKWPPQSPERYTTTGNCRVGFAVDRLISLDCPTLTMPGAYPAPNHYSMTFDLATGKVFRITELFKSDVNVPLRLALFLNDAWWEMGHTIGVSPPIGAIEAGEDIDFYFEDNCEKSLKYRPKNMRFSSAKVCMVISNAGGMSGPSRGMGLYANLSSVKDILDTRSALRALQQRL
jgi:hypothetical protein